MDEFLSNCVKAVCINIYLLLSPYLTTRLAISRLTQDKKTGKNTLNATKQPKKLAFIFLE
jgi:hypothetical protein